MCAVIDLDETLVHSSFKRLPDADFVIGVEIEGIVHRVHVMKRPFAEQFLQRAAQLFECVMFTASLAKYADPVADHIDRSRAFSHRLFRESCVLHNDSFVKDLAMLGRPLERCLIIDNSPASYMLNRENAIQVKSWVGDRTDTELRDLLPYLQQQQQLGGKAGAQLRQIQQRQLQYRSVAVKAKRAGDMELAKQYLAYAKGCDRMVQAAQAGMPIDLGQLPSLPGEEAGGQAGGINVSEVCEAPEELRGEALKDPARVYAALERTLKEKLAVAEENAKKFKSLGQIATADRWSKLARGATADLDFVLGQKRRRQPPPAFRFAWQTVSAVRCNTDLGDNTLEVQVLSGIKLPVPEGFKDTDLDTYVRAELPISTESPLSQASDWSKGSADPAYNFSARFEINRKSRAIGRVFKTRGLKFEVFYRRGFLKKDGLLGTATLKLDALDTQCTVHIGVDLYEGRKAVGGRLEVKVRLREPLTGTQTDQVREQWLIIQHPGGQEASQVSSATSRQQPQQQAKSSNVPQESAYVLQRDIGALKPFAKTNPRAAEASKQLQRKLAEHSQQLAACSQDELREYLRVLQRVAASYGQQAAAQAKTDRAKADKMIDKKREAEREFQDVSAKLR